MKTLYFPIIIVLGVLITSCADEHPPSNSIEEPEIIVPIQFAQSLYSEYETSRVDLIEAAQNIDENGDSIPPDDPRYIRASRSLTVDYVKLKQYLAFIEQEAKKAQVNIEGLRIYLGKYIDDTKFPDGTSVPYPGSETVFLNPIMKHENDTIPFAIQYTHDNQTIAIPIGQINKRTNQKSLTKNNENDSIQSLASNTFTKRPPPYNEENDYN